MCGGKSHVALADHNDPANGRVQRVLPSGELTHAPSLSSNRIRRTERVCRIQPQVRWYWRPGPALALACHHDGVALHIGRALALIGFGLFLGFVGLIWVANLFTGSDR
jgi:hypothetical protein